MFETAFGLWLSKLLPLILYPVGATLALMALGGLLAMSGSARLGRLSVTAAFVLLWVCSTPIFADWALATLESQYPSVSLSETRQADVAIVLGGAVRQPLAPRRGAELNEAGDRILHAARLYRSGKVKRVLVTGGNVPWSASVTPEAELIRAFLIEWGVQPEAITIASQSRNTYENAIEIKRILTDQPFATGLLVTSASHMPRAMAVFQKAGIQVVAAPTDVLGAADRNDGILLWLPDAGSLYLTTIVVKEWIGYGAYFYRGYL